MIQMYNTCNSTLLEQAKLCGPMPAQTVYTSTSNLMMLQFKSDDSTAFKGFRLLYSEGILIQSRAEGIIQLNQETSLKSHTCKSDFLNWQLVTISANQMLQFWDYSPISVLWSRAQMLVIYTFILYVTFQENDRSWWFFNVVF
jgi:hypothetical protein